MKGFTSEKELATPSGFEPELSGPKPLVLPLHNGVAEMPFTINLFQVFSSRTGKIIPFLPPVS